MKQLSSLLVDGLLATPAFAAEADLSKLPPPSDKKGLTYEKDIRPLFEASCFGCHSPQRPRPAGGLRLDTLELTLKGGREGTVIIPGDSANSKLVIAVAQLDPRSAMPPPPRRGRGQGNPGNPQNPPGAPTQPQTMADGDHPGTTNPPAGGQRGPQGPPAKPLTRDQVGFVRAWIDQGAK